MARAHTVAFTSRFCTTYLHFDSREEARRACERHYATKFYTLCDILASYAGERPVRRKKRKPKLRRPLTLEPVPAVALFDYSFPAHLALAREAIPSPEPDKREHRAPVVRLRVHKQWLPSTADGEGDDTSDQEIER